MLLVVLLNWIEIMSAINLFIAAAAAPLLSAWALGRAPAKWI